MADNSESMGESTNNSCKNQKEIESFLKYLNSFLLIYGTKYETENIWSMHNIKVKLPFGYISEKLDDSQFQKWTDMSVENALNELRDKVIGTYKVYSTLIKQLIDKLKLQDQQEEKNFDDEVYRVLELIQLTQNHLNRTPDNMDIDESIVDHGYDFDKSVDHKEIILREQYTATKFLHTLYTKLHETCTNLNDAT